MIVCLEQRRASAEGLGRRRPVGLVSLRVEQVEDKERFKITCLAHASAPLCLARFSL